jgi:D-tyrosyl-tRNA(Tyr) deacylase
VRAVVQRVRSASVEVDGRVAGKIDRGIVVFLGIGRGDGAEATRYLGEKILDLRIFPDERHSMNRSLREVRGEILLVSQFTLYGDCRKGRRPSFDRAESPGPAEEAYREFAQYLADQGHPPSEGVFGASMLVRLENDGPVTLLLDSEKEF